MYKAFHKHVFPSPAIRPIGLFAASTPMTAFFCILFGGMWAGRRARWTPLTISASAVSKNYKFFVLPDSPACRRCPALVP